MSRKTVVLGASENPERYAYLAVLKLQRFGHEVVAVGLKEGMIGENKILAGQPVIPGVDTITVYVGPKNQPAWYEYIFSLNPKRIILNPGAENPELEQLARARGIEVTEACTLVLLSLGTY